jgi:hypothetical protein
VTKPDTVSEVFHLGDTRSRSRKKNTVEAIKAIVMSQNEIPTKSSGFSSAPDAATDCVETAAATTPKPNPKAALDPIFLNIMRFTPLNA